MEELMLEYLDEILYIVTNHSEQGQANYSMNSEQIRLMLNAKYSIDLSLQKLNLLIEKLVNDGNLTMNNKSVAIYTLTYKGAFFQGYINQKEINTFNLELNRIDLILRKRNDRRLTLYTLLAGIAGFAIVLWDVIKYLLEHYYYL
jgi:hypothetical protein